MTTTTRKVPEVIIQAAVDLGMAQAAREDAERRAGKGYPNANRDEAMTLAVYKQKLEVFESLVLYFARTRP